MQQLTDTENDNLGTWEGVIADLAVKRQSARDHGEQLRAQKRDLVLEAAMGGSDAKRRLERVNAELRKLAFEVDDLDQAVTQAETAKRAAEAVAAEDRERARQAEISALASAAIRHAAEFTDALRQAVNAGAALKLVIQNMASRATPTERPHLDRLLQPGPYMRAAEYSGLRSHLEFAPYIGPKAHVVALEDELAIHLERWLTKPDEKKEEENGNQH